MPFAAVKHQLPFLLDDICFVVMRAFYPSTMRFLKHLHFVRYHFALTHCSCQGSASICQDIGILPQQRLFPITFSSVGPYRNKFSAVRQQINACCAPPQILVCRFLRAATAHFVLSRHQTPNPFSVSPNHWVHLIIINPRQAEPTTRTDFRARLHYLRTELHKLSTLVTEHGGWEHVRHRQQTLW